MRKQLLLTAGTLVLAASMIVALEAVLRVAGIGTEAAEAKSRLGYQQVAVPILLPALRTDGTPVLRPRDPRLPFQEILRDKPDDLFRVFVFGGSATAGLGFSPNVTFARYLERMLREALPGMSLEVVNLGIVALSSKQVRLLVEDVCAHDEPDLLIVYSGNNEFLEIHARLYAERNANTLERFRGSLASTHLFRLLSPLVRRSEPAPALTNRDLARSELRLTQDEIIREIVLSAQDAERVVEEYETNLAQIATTARAQRTPLVLMSVASNWEWRGREDLPPDHLVQLLGTSDKSGDALHRAALAALNRKLEDATDPKRHEWLFQRALVLRAMGDFAAAVSSYRAAMNADPHLRRALDRMNEQVREVADRHGVDFLDSVAVLGRHAEHGIIGFGDFYDYVHMTPRGAVVLAAALLAKLRERHWIPVPEQPFSEWEFARREIQRTSQLASDDFALDRWLGIGFEPQRIADRNLWKYQEMLADLDARIERDPTNVAALVYRGNAHAHELNGASAAVADYRAALGHLVDVAEDAGAVERAATADRGHDAAAIRANLARVLASRAP